MINVKTVENAINNDIFIKKYTQGKNYPLSFCCYKIKVSELANGEYNYNYKLDLSIKYDDKVVYENAVLRINYGSQMRLKNQMEYEYRALEYLKDTDLTPSPIFLDCSKKLLEKDFLVMSFIEGREFDYKKDLVYGANCLAKIHRYKSNYNYDFIEHQNPFLAIIDECKLMYSKYEESRLFNIDIDKRIKKIFESANKILKEKDFKNDSELTLINTELNSSNFIMKDDKCYLLDWEKPIIGEKEQDLGHFLAPTTTFWKTDIILSKREIDNFINIYYNIYYSEDCFLPCKIKSDNYYIEFKEKVYKYIIFNCLRGITWCAMAWVEYNNSEKSLINEFTFNKLKDYLELDFIDNVIKNFI